VGGPGVEPRGLHYFYKENISQSNEGHVAPKHWATCPLLIRFQYDTCQHTIRPRQPMKMCQRTTNRCAPCHHDGTALHVAVRTVRTGTVSIPNFCLFGLAVRSRYLLHTDSVCESKYTAGIRKTRQTQWHCFRRIPSTLKIEQNLIP
jgi:hypothetical protein